jgi:hypothetical protein
MIDAHAMQIGWCFGSSEGRFGKIISSLRLGRTSVVDMIEQFYSTNLRRLSQ